jgi:hypothetical protein
MVKGQSEGSNKMDYTQNLNETDFRHGILLLERFLKENSTVLSLIGIFSAVLVYIISDISDIFSQFELAIAYSAGIGILSLLLTIILSDFISTIRYFDNYFAPATMLIWTFISLLVALLGIIISSLSEFIQQIEDIFLFLSLIFPVFFSFWLDSYNLSEKVEQVYDVNDEYFVFSLIVQPLIVITLVVLIRYSISSKIFGPLFYIGDSYNDDLFLSILYNTFTTVGIFSLTNLFFPITFLIAGIARLVIAGIIFTITKPFKIAVRKFIQFILE